VVLAAGQIRQRFQQRMPLIHLSVPVAAHDQRPGILQVSAHEPQQGQ
jgi:hypothetical protein